MLETTPAEAAIREAITRQGAITFRQFMEMALYSAPGAYYASGTGQIGPGGDYFTSPEIHPSFGALVARQIEQVWVAMDRPAAFTVVEMGAGSGALARDILAYAMTWSPAFYAALHYEIVERGPDFARRQKETISRLATAVGKVRWHLSEGLDLPPESVDGCFLSNELPDAFPVHRVTVEGGVLREIYVTAEANHLAERTGAPSTPALADYFSRLGFLPPEGARVEVNLDALGWMRAVAALLRRGAAITIDYGYTAEDLYSERRPQGTLLCFYRHALADDPYVRVGLQDMTSHVDFTSLAADGEAAGLRTVGIATQQDFLTALGMDVYLSQLSAAGLRAADYEANRLGMRELLDPAGLGRVKVLIQQKGLQGLDPAALRPEGIQPGDLARDTAAEPPPLLTRSHMRLNSQPNLDQFVDTQSMWNELMGDDE